MIRPKFSLEFEVLSPDEIMVVNSNGQNFLTSRAFFDKHLADIQDQLS